MVLKLYMFPHSPPVRGVLITAKHLNLDLEIIKVNTLTGEQHSPEYLKLNPQHTIPTLDDEGFIIWDSHAVAPYLAEKYGKDDSLYPEDPQKKAVVNQRLHFDNGVFFNRFIAVRPIIGEGRFPNEQELAPLVEVYGILEAFLEKGQYIAGDTLTVADFSIVSSLSSTAIILSVDETKWPKLATWFKKMQALPAYEANKEGLEALTNLIQGHIKK